MNKRTTRQQAYDIWKSIESHFEGSNTKNFANSADPQKRVEHGKKIGKECVESGRQAKNAVKGGKTVTEVKLESIRKRAKEQRQYSDEQVLEMKELYTNDITIDFDHLATKYGCSVSQISLIMNGKQYADVGEVVKIRPALFKCPHCDAPPMIKSNLTRHHGDKCKLKDIDTNEIRKEYNKGGTSFMKLAKKYGLTPTMIDTIVNRK